VLNLPTQPPRLTKHRATINKVTCLRGRHGVEEGYSGSSMAMKGERGWDSECLQITAHMDTFLSLPSS
jgi:hypothetical protein